MRDSDSIPLYLFAKAPVAGKVKTRMYPHLTPTQSADLASMMLAQSVRKAAEYWPGRLVLTVAPDMEHKLFQSLQRQHHFEFQVQVSGDLGVRLRHVLEQGIHTYGAAAVMGCDVPHFSGKILSEAHDRMSEGENVVGPAEDGGFYLLGLQRIEKMLFYQIPWGEGGVFQQLRKNAKQMPLELETLQTLRDIDTWSDLQWLSVHDPRYGIFTNLS